jgi:threonine dehydrogenase-like Zn-dependent dehydrogenase
MPLASLTTLDRFALRRAASRAMGASNALDPADAEAIRLASLHDADLTYELSGSPEALDLAIALTGFNGRIVVGSWYGVKHAPLELGSHFHRSRIRLISSQVSTLAPALTGRWTKARRMEVAWAMLARLPINQLMTHRFALADAAQAYALLDQHPEQALQVLFTY